MDIKIITDFFLKEKTEKVLTLLSFLLFLSAFVGAIKPFALLETPSIYRLLFGIGLTAFFIILFFTDIFSKRQKISFNKDKAIVLPDIEITLKFGSIEDKITDEEIRSAIVLPANSSLDDQCLNDEKSSLGAYVLKRLPCKKETFINEIKQFKGSTESFPIGTSFLLKANYKVSNQIIITCVSQISEEKGVTSFPEFIPICINKIFELASRDKIKHIIMPIIGSGHGGIGKSEALHILLYSASFYAKRFHQITNLTILIHEKDKENLESQLCIFNKYKT